MKVRMLVGENAGKIEELNDELADGYVMLGKAMYLDSEGEETEISDEGLDDIVDLPDPE